jgi:hypothetical protein
VALFNAIAKAKRDTVAAEESAKPKKAVANDDNGSVISRESAGRTTKAGKSAKSAQQLDGEQGTGKVDKEKEAEKVTKWAALRDDYMVGQKLTVKVGAAAVLLHTRLMFRSSALRFSSYLLLLILCTAFLPSWQHWDKAAESDSD